MQTFSAVKFHYKAHDQQGGAQGAFYNGVLPRNFRDYRYYDLLLSTFVVILLISNLVGQKICAFGPLRISGAQLLFPITYIFGDIFTEVYGYSASRRAIWLGFFASGLMAVMGLVTVALPAAPEWPNQRAFATVFDFVPRLVIASLIAFWCGEFANSFVMAKMKLWTGGRQLWTRTVGSTVVGQAVDSTIMMFVGFGGILSVSAIVMLIVSGYVGKVLYEVLMTPLTYLVVNGLKKAEKIDTFDYCTDFNPFSVLKTADPESEAAERSTGTPA